MNSSYARLMSAKFKRRDDRSVEESHRSAVRGQSVEPRVQLLLVLPQEQAGLVESQAVLVADVHRRRPVDRLQIGMNARTDASPSGRRGRLGNRSKAARGLAPGHLPRILNRRVKRSAR